MHTLKFFETDEAGKTLDNYYNSIMVTKVEEASADVSKNPEKAPSSPNVKEEKGLKTLNKPEEQQPDASISNEKTPDGNQDEEDKKPDDGEDPNQSKSSCKRNETI